MVFEENFLRMTITVRFQKMSALKRWNLFTDFLVSSNNAVFTKQIYFSPAFFKLWVYIFEKLAGVVGDSQYY